MNYLETVNPNILGNLKTYQLIRTKSSSKLTNNGSNSGSQVSCTPFKVYNNNLTERVIRKRHARRGFNSEAILFYEYIDGNLERNSTVITLNRVTVMKFCKARVTKFNELIELFIKRGILTPITTTRKPVYHVSPNHIFFGDLTDYLIQHYLEKLIFKERIRGTNRVNDISAKEAFPELYLERNPKSMFKVDTSIVKEF